MTSHCHGLHDILVFSLMSLRFVLFVQSLVFCSVLCGPLFVLLSFCFVCYSKTNDFWLQPWYLQTVLAIYNKSSQWFNCHLGTDCPFGSPEYSRYSVGNLMLDLSFLCSVCRSLFIILTFFSFTIILCVFLPINRLVSSSILATFK